MSQNKIHLRSKLKACIGELAIQGVKGGIDTEMDFTKNSYFEDNVPSEITSRDPTD